MANKHVHLDDLKDKLQDAKRAAHMPDASEREKADAKLLEQEVAAESSRPNTPRRRNQRPPTRTPSSTRR